MSLGYQETLITSQVDGPTLTAAATATCLPGQALYTLPANFFRNTGQQFLLQASGRISCAVTTPGTARYQMKLGATVVLDSLAMNLNIVAKTTVPWLLEMRMTVTLMGASATVNWSGFWESEAAIASPLPTVGGSGKFLLPYNAVEGSNTATFSTATSQQVDLHFTQTVATGSMTLKQYSLTSIN